MNEANGIGKINAANARSWYEKRLADAETARQRGMFDIEAEWRSDAKRISEEFSLRLVDV